MTMILKFKSKYFTLAYSQALREFRIPATTNYRLDKGWYVRYY